MDYAAPITVGNNTVFGYEAMCGNRVVLRAGITDGVAYGDGQVTDVDLLNMLGLYDQFNKNAQGDPSAYSIGLWPAHSDDYSTLSTPTPGAANIPEPTSLCLLALGAMTLHRRT